MKRYDYSGCDECSFGQLEESPGGDWMDAEEVIPRIAELEARRRDLRDAVAGVAAFIDVLSINTVMTYQISDRLKAALAKIAES